MQKNIYLFNVTLAEFYRHDFKESNDYAIRFSNLFSIPDHYMRCIIDTLINPSPAEGVYIASQTFKLDLWKRQKELRSGVKKEENGESEKTSKEWKLAGFMPLFNHCLQSSNFVCKCS